MTNNWRSPLSFILGAVGLFCVTSVCVTPVTLAELDYSKLAGVHGVLKPEYGDLSPIYGFSHLRKGILENLYRFGDKERDQNKPFAGEDPTIGLIREMFTIPPGDQGNFLPTKLPLKPAYYFKSSTIGKILNILVVENVGWEGLKAKLDSGEKEKELKHILLDAIEDDIGIYSKVGKKIRALKQNQKVRGSDPEGAFGIQDQIERMEAFQKKLSADGALGNAAQDLEKWVELLLSALKGSLREGASSGGLSGVGTELEGKIEARTEAGAGEYPYPKEFPLQVLLSYLWLKAQDDPNEISAFFRQMPEGLKNPERVKAKNFLPKSFTQKDYQQWVDKTAKLPSKDLIQELEKNPEKALFYARAYEVYDRSLPPLVRQDTAAYHPDHAAEELQKLFADHKILQCDGKAMVAIPGLICYPDCFESTHRNLALLFEALPEDAKRGLSEDAPREESGRSNGRLVDTRWLVEKAKKLGHQISPEYLKHFAAHPSLSNPFGLLSRNSWSRLNCGLVSGSSVRVDVAYNNGICDMKPTVDNLLSFYAHHFFSEDAQGRYSKHKTRIEKLQYLCDFLSRDARRLSWKPRGLDEKELDREEINQRNTNLILDFEIHEKPAFRFRIETGHAVPFDLTQTRESWKEKVASGIQDELVGKRDVTSSTRSVLLAWYSKPEIRPKMLWKLVQNGLQKEAVFGLFNQPLMDVEAKFKFMEAVAVLKLKHMYGVARHIEAKLPDDLDNKMRISALWADHGYPLGVPAHAVGSPEITYRPVGEEILSKLFAPDVANLLGNAWARSWTDEKREREEKTKVIWGDTVRDEEKEDDIQMNWETAMEYCLKLNSESKRKEVEVALEKIESNEELKALRSAYLAGGNAGSREALLKRYEELKPNPIPGCSLPPVEEFIMLLDDLKYGEDSWQYIPQFLPHFFKDRRGENRLFWSSSGLPNIAKYALDVGGQFGAVNPGPRVSDRSVRCTCGVAVR